jgi:hypothetical protein
MWRLLIERSDLVAKRVVFLKEMHEVTQQTFNIFKIIVSSVLLYKFPRKSRAPLPSGVASTF